MAPTKAAQARAAKKEKQYSKRQLAWEQKIKFLKKYLNVLETNFECDEYSQLFRKGFSGGHTYKNVHEEVWRNLTTAEREEFDAFNDPAKIRRFINNLKFVFSPLNKRRHINLHNKQWLFMQLSSLEFNFLPQHHRDVEAIQIQQIESKHLKA